MTGVEVGIAGALSKIVGVAPMEYVESRGTVDAVVTVETSADKSLLFFLDGSRWIALDLDIQTMNGYQGHANLRDVERICQASRSCLWKCGIDRGCDDHSDGRYSIYASRK